MDAKKAYVYIALSQHGTQLHLTTPAMGSDWKLWALCGCSVHLAYIVPAGMSVCKHCLAQDAKERRAR